MTEPVEIIPDAFYDDRSLQLSLGLSEGTLAGARKAGELRFTRKGQRTLYLGRWVAEWLSRDAGRSGERAHCPDKGEAVVCGVAEKRNASVCRAGVLQDSLTPGADQATGIGGESLDGKHTR